VGGRHLCDKNLIFLDISPDVDDIAAIEIMALNKRIAIVTYCRPPYNDVINKIILAYFIDGDDHCIIAGDLNAKHQFLGCTHTNKTGE
jgi:hypothetical protein